MAGNKPEDFHITALYNEMETDEAVVPKGVYPYKYIDSWERVQEVLPSQEALHSCLGDKDIMATNMRRRSEDLISTLDALNLSHTCLAVKASTPPTTLRALDCHAVP